MKKMQMDEFYNLKLGRYKAFSISGKNRNFYLYNVGGVLVSGKIDSLDGCPKMNAIVKILGNCLTNEWKEEMPEIFENGKVSHKFYTMVFDELIELVYNRIGLRFACIGQLPNGYIFTMNPDLLPE